MVKCRECNKEYNPLIEGASSSGFAGYCRKCELKIIKKEWVKIRSLKGISFNKKTKGRYGKNGNK
ncbi:hypothetical protein AUJ66_08775 [Candidatus Desantisbacteria bacterium CG1_02_38_46]|uniref:Uncharacterized protein n=2 Tax=unclassified Candidatus Desantisiibacteriota TaxID=3106372 RepID=A0A1J4S8A2_9BACT|nr:MAG: hypothetical protein AUJ66_08775 [Candidatus Desantisbacteria bacterium CG1_02_38_46]PIU51029.1 MAG: hypothetical protein COS91_06515 [Candidatus Desantisbacteria bacterium CG07_land_8_20_14_0_80_39_15]